ncbi:hypothetical protein K8Q93_03225 [Candidatus Parcubacteria bacterium]|nr:hypothetical protein [Candidatus Parcubacteria bacterium]
MNTIKETPFFRKETDHFVLYKPAPLPKGKKKLVEVSGIQAVGRFKTWQEAQIESLRHFGRKAAKVI